MGEVPGSKGESDVHHGAHWPIQQWLRATCFEGCSVKGRVLSDINAQNIPRGKRKLTAYPQQCAKAASCTVHCADHSKATTAQCDVQCAL